MTDKKPQSKPQRSAALPPPEQTEPAPPPPPRAPRAHRGDVVPVLYAAGFVVLAAAIVWLWQNPPAAPPAPPSPPSAEAAELRQQVQALQDRLARLEQRPAPAIPAPADLGPLNARIATLEARKPPAPVDLAPLEAAIGALQQRSSVDAALSARMDALVGRLDALTSRIEATDSALQRRQDATDSRLTPLEKDAGKISSLADRAARIARIQAAQAALDGGVPLGEIPGAPSALARYATVAPPTPASLRLSFPAAAQAALAASRPSVDNKPFLDRAWAQAQTLITLRQGDNVIVGDPAAGIIARAQAALNAGDMAGTVAALDALTGPAAAAVAGWKAQAQGLLDARSALADMAAHA
jgi:hypothetical protein